MGREAAVVCLQCTGGSQNTVPVLVQAGKRLAMHVVRNRLSLAMLFLVCIAGGSVWF